MNTQLMLFVGIFARPCVFASVFHIPTYYALRRGFVPMFDFIYYAKSRFLLLLPGLRHFTEVQQGSKGVIRYQDILYVQGCTPL